MAPDGLNGNGWDRWSKHIIAELDRLNTCYEKLDDKIDKLTVEVAMLKVKAGMWGGVTGLVVAVATFIVHEFATVPK